MCCDEAQEEKDYLDDRIATSMSPANSLSYKLISNNVLWWQNATKKIEQLEKKNTR